MTAREIILCEAGFPIGTGACRICGATAAGNCRVSGSPESSTELSLYKEIQALRQRVVELEADLLKGITGAEYLDVWIERRNFWQEKAEGFLANAHTWKDLATEQQGLRIAAEAKLEAVRRVRNDLATQCTNSHAVKALDKALLNKGEV